MTDSIYYNVRCQNNESRDRLRQMVKIEAAKRNMSQEQVLYHALYFLMSWGEKIENGAEVVINTGGVRNTKL